MFGELDCNAGGAECRTDLFNDIVIFALVAVNLVYNEESGLVQFLDKTVAVDQAYVNTT